MNSPNILDHVTPAVATYSTDANGNPIALIAPNGNNIFQTVYPNLLAGSANATANTAVLNAIAASWASITQTAPGTSRWNIVFPDGDIYYNGVVTWQSYNNTDYSDLSSIECEWPTFTSNGITTFVWTGGQFDGQGSDPAATTPATWQFYLGTANSQATGLKFSNIRWQGQGVSVVSTTSTGTITTAATTIAVTSATGFYIGGAICISADASGGTQSSPPWWATITNIASLTITFSPATPAANFSATSGNVVMAFPQTRALQIGGLTAAQDVNTNVRFENCVFIDWFSALVVSDVTRHSYKQVVFDRCMFGNELGYNCDLPIFDQCVVRNQLSVTPFANASVTSTLYTITFGGSNPTNLLKVGMSMSDITAPATAQAFPEYAVITQINSNTMVTMSHPSSLTGVSNRNFMPSMGWMFNMGLGGSPFIPGASTYSAGVRGGTDSTRVIHPQLNGARGLYTCDSGSNSEIRVESLYVENAQRIALIGNQGGTSSTGPYLFHGGVLTTGASFTGIPIENMGGGVFEVNDLGSSGTFQYPLVQNKTSAASTLIQWSRNSITSSATRGKLTPNNSYGNSTANTLVPSSTDCILVSTTLPTASGYFSSYTAAGATTTPEINGVDGMVLTLTHATAFANQSTGSLIPGKKFRLTCLQGSTGSYNLTWGTNYYYNNAGALTAMPTITGAAAGTGCTFDFTVTNTASGLLYILQGVNATAAMPVFF